MSKFRILTPAGPSSTTPGGGYDFEMEALEGVGAEIVECPATEEGFIAAAKGVDAVYAKGMKFTRAMIDALDGCRVIALGSVGVDYVDVAAATAKGIPVTNCPDTFIEEVADHVMMLLLATHRRALEQDRMVREGRWREGRPQLLEVPRLMGQTLGFIAFGHVPRAVARRALPFGLRLLAYDPFLNELGIGALGVEPAQLDARVAALTDAELSTLAGQMLSGLGRLNATDPATQSLTSDSSTITWLRGGTSPEVWRTTFEHSLDGSTWTDESANMLAAAGNQSMLNLWQMAGGSQAQPPWTANFQLRNNADRYSPLNSSSPIYSNILNLDRPSVTPLFCRNH